MNRITCYITRLLVTLAVCVLTVTTVHAFNAETYSAASVLSTGNWVKISVQKSGMHFIPVSELRRMGFSDASRVRVYGYGAMRLPDRLDVSTYIDDLPLVQTVNTAQGIYFYAVGPVTTPESTTIGQFTIAINPYTTVGYYFLSDNDVPERPVGEGNAMPTESVSSSYQEVVYHKLELVNIGETGNTLLGEDFSLRSTQSFPFDMPGRVEGSKAWLECSFYARSANSSRIVLSVNDNALTYSTSDNMNAIGSGDHYTHAVRCVTRKAFDVSGQRATVSVTHSASGAVSMARLDYLVLNYERELALTSGLCDFHLTSTGGVLKGATEGTIVWDVTDPLNVISVPATFEGGQLRWVPVANGSRHYVAWQPGASVSSPQVVSTVANQNLHNEPVPDMVIFSHPDWISQAERVARMHREGPDSLRVLVVDCNRVYNEFASGAPDANALRYMLKMFWDRSSTSDTKLRYALIMGRCVYDNRRITPTIASLNYKTIAGWQTDNSLSDNTSYTTDDIYALLRDGAGTNLGSDYQCIAVGRMPVVSLSDATAVVDKLDSYVNTPINTGWKNRALMIADDENSGLFMIHSEDMINAAMSVPGGQRILWDKVYIDAYMKQNGTYPGARNDMFRALTEGVVWWNFAGHANPTSWTGDGLMTYTDVNNLYLKHFPFVVAATCDFIRWDASSISAAEILYRTPSSGIIGAISATRPAYIDSNGRFMAIMGQYMFATDSDGRNLTIGEIFRRTKNNSSGSGTWNNDNKLRYVLMGDPAMRLCTPNMLVRLDSIGGVESDIELQPTIMASQDVVMKGTVTDYNGNRVTDFNGKLYLTLFDAEYSTTSHGYGEDGENITFEQHGKRLQAVVDTIADGEFTAHVVMPSEIANNFRPATLNMYAVTADGTRDAIGVNRDFYVYGVDDNAAEDTEPPVIEAFYLNHSSFGNGDFVNSTPVAIAMLRDNRSINLSTAGIGHQMLLTVDGRPLTDTPLYYTPYSDGTPGGTLVYQLDELDRGGHELQLRVWDTSGNSATATIDFNVSPGLVPKLYDLYADTNPASVDTRFYLTHDRPDALITVNIEVFNMLGRPVWSTSVTGMSDMLRSFPVTWNLSDKAGRRVPRGIYLYRASITTSTGETSATKTRRIAVTAGQ